MEALKMLGDNHSFYVKSNGGFISAGTLHCNAQNITKPASPSGIGYVKVNGEVIAISFIGRDNTKSFGSPTCGASTGNQPFTLSDNSTLFLTTVYLADRNKNLFGIPVEPDLNSANENIIQDALEWIEN